MADHLDRLLEEDDERRNPELDEAIEETKRRIKEAFRDVATWYRANSHSIVDDIADGREPDTQETGETDG